MNAKDILKTMSPFELPSMTPMNEIIPLMRPSTRVKFTISTI